MVVAVGAIGQSVYHPAVSSSKIQIHPPTSSSTKNVFVAGTNAFVIRAVDGDTVDIELDGDSQEHKIRLLGVNTPESVDPRRPVQCFGKEASHFTDQSLTGTRVRLEEDLLADNVDPYGRWLRNIYLPDGMDFNAELVRQGYAYAYVSFPMDKQRRAELKRLQSEAMQAKRGLWNPQTCNGKK